MVFSVTHVSGAMDSCPTLASLVDLLDELGNADTEHPDVAVGHESGWTLSVYPNGLVVLEDVESDSEPMHRAGVSKEEALGICLLVALGRLDRVRSLQWETGYP